MTSFPLMNYVYGDFYHQAKQYDLHSLIYGITSNF